MTSSSQLTSQKSNRKDNLLAFYFLWVVVSAAVWGAARLLCYTLNADIPSARLKPLFSFSLEDLLFVFQGLLIGALLGFSQSSLLKSLGKSIDQWPIIHTISCVAAFVVALLVDAFLFPPKLFVDPSGLVFGFGGATAGALQWLFLRRYGARLLQWLALTMLGWASGEMIGASVFLAIKSYVSSSLTFFVYGCITGLPIGVFTALAFRGLLNRYQNP